MNFVIQIKRTLVNVFADSCNTCDRRFCIRNVQIVSAKGKRKLRMTGFPFGDGEYQQGQPDKTESEKLCHAEGFVKEEDAQEQGHGWADVLEEAQHI